MTRTTKRRWRFLLALQVLLVIVLIFGDIGFDKPGKFGLAFGTLLLCGGTLLVASFVGLVLNIRNRAWGAALVQIMLPLVAFAGLIALDR